jgi:hypothetical protein
MVTQLQLQALSKEQSDAYYQRLTQNFSDSIFDGALFVTRQEIYDEIVRTIPNTPIHTLLPIEPVTPPRTRPRSSTMTPPPAPRKRRVSKKKVIGNTRKMTPELISLLEKGNSLDKYACVIVYASDCAVKTSKYLGEHVEATKYLYLDRIFVESAVLTGETIKELSRMRDIKKLLHEVDMNDLKLFQ